MNCVKPSTWLVNLRFTEDKEEQEEVDEEERVEDVENVYLLGSSDEGYWDYRNLKSFFSF